MADASANIRFAATMKKISKYLFWIIGAILVIGSAYVLYNTMNRPVAGVLVFLAGVLALFFYYTKWFVLAEKANVWPPFQTPCPDYLTLMSPGANLQGGDGSQMKDKYKCLDFVGVSRNGLLKRANPESANMQINQPEYAFNVDPTMSRAALQDNANRYGLTWSTLLGE